MGPPPIEDSYFYINIDAIKGVILFPTLGTPAIIEPNGDLTIYLALQKNGFDKHVNHGGGESPGSPTTLELATRIYFQTMITPWSNRGRDYVDYKKYSDELASEAAAFKRFYPDFKIAEAMFNEKKFGGFYVGEFEIDKEFLAEYYPLGDAVAPPPGPFGVIHKAAVNMYLSGVLTQTIPKEEDKKPSDQGAQTGQEEKNPSVEPDPKHGKEVGYRYVFQFTMRGAQRLNAKGLYELMFLYLNYEQYGKALEDWKNNKHWLFKKEGDFHEHYLTNPGDELLSNTLISELKAKAAQIETESPIMTTVEFGRFPHMEPDTLRLVKLYDCAPVSVMTQGQKNMVGTPQKERGGGVKYLHYLSDKNGWFVLSRHPVYITDKEYLDLGVVSDLHLSARQASYKLVAPQIIHGAMESESPYLGQLCHQALETSQRLMKSIGAESDALIVAGDAFDVLRNLDPLVVESKTLALRSSDGPGESPLEDRLPEPTQTPQPGQPTNPDESPQSAEKEIRMSTAELWEHLDFKKHEKKAPNYPFYIDALMFMGLLLDYYKETGKPVFYITGNHEGYEVPYGISPRPMFMNNNVFVFRPNPGIPSDQNLTFYEAALLFGEKYSFLGRIANFKKENLAWAYRWITPWKDCLVNCAKNQNLLLLGWDDDENFLWSAISGGGSLPRAGSAFTDNQLNLLKRMTGQGDKFNALASHFTYANFDLEIPLHKQDQELSGTWFLSLEKTDTGTFEEKRTAVYSELTGGKVKLTVSGHSHRSGAYTCLSDGLVDGLKLGDSKGGPGGVSLSEGNRSIKSVDPKEQFPGNVACLVSGSGGLYSYQNLNHQKLSDIDKPQGMIIKCDPAGNLEKVDYVRDASSPKPRLAVRCDYLWYENRTQMFFERPDTERKGDIVASGKSKSEGNYNIYLNPKWLYFLNSERHIHDRDLPIANFTLHCVCKIGYEYFQSHFVTLEIEVDPKYPLKNHKDVPEYQLKGGPDTVREFMAKRLLLGFADNDEAILYFLSVHFNKAHPIAQHYDLSSPWCYPVTVNANKTVIKRKFGRDGELPRYDLLMKIPEYNPTVNRK
ncbi:MAG: hypothetical protein LBF38_10680 [Deltaproteobacteria bacterium]|jgi:hypothetical protein|nr:hypothetical protein [Deltaproteobacteria bacterium]